MNAAIDEDNVSALQSFLKKNSWSKSFFEWAEARKNDARVTNIERIETRTGIEYYAIITIARKLEELGLARFVVGRKGSASRIEWKYSLRNIGAATLGNTNNLSEISGEIEDEEDELTDFHADNVDKGKMIDKIDHIFALRPDISIKFELPEDLTAKEAERLAGFIITLPFDV